MRRRPILVARGWAIQSSNSPRKDPKYQCREHATVDCRLGCFDFAQFLLRDAGVWEEHLALSGLHLQVPYKSTNLKQRVPR